MVLVDFWCRWPGRSSKRWQPVQPGCPTFHRNVGFKWVRARHLQKRTANPSRGSLSFGAGGRARTGTVSLPVDFESTTSTNSITPAWECGTLYSIIQSPEKCKHNFFLPGFCPAGTGFFRFRRKPYFSRITGQSPSSRALRMCSAAAWGESFTCSPVAIFFTEHIPSAISSSPSSTVKGTASLLA